MTTEQQNELYEKIKTYFGGPNIDENGEIKDISYDWVTKNEAIKHLCEPYEVIYNSNDKNINTINNILLNNYKNNKDVTSLRNPFGIIENHDFTCELKLLKWITEEEKIEEKNEEIKEKEKKEEKNEEEKKEEKNEEEKKEEKNEEEKKEEKNEEEIKEEKNEEIKEEEKIEEKKDEGKDEINEEQKKEKKDQIEKEQKMKL